MTPFKRKRLAAGLTQEQLADRMGVSQRAVAKWDTGDSMPEPRRYPLLATIFGISPDEIVHLFAPVASGHAAERVN